jgi:hypothetical protein
LTPVEDGPAAALGLKPKNPVEAGADDDGRIGDDAGAVKVDVA